MEPHSARGETTAQRAACSVQPAREGSAHLGTSTEPTTYLFLQTTQCRPLPAHRWQLSCLCTHAGLAAAAGRMNTGSAPPERCRPAAFGFCTGSLLGCTVAARTFGGITHTAATKLPPAAAQFLASTQRPARRYVWRLSGLFVRRSSQQNVRDCKGDPRVPVPHRPWYEACAPHQGVLVTGRAQRLTALLVHVATST